MSLEDTLEALTKMAKMDMTATFVARCRSISASNAPPTLECIYTQIVTAINYVKDTEIVVKGGDKIWDKGFKEPLELLRTLCKKSGELMDLLGLDLNEKYWKAVIKGSGTAANIYDTFHQLPSCREHFNLRDSGIEYLMVKYVSFLMDERNADAVVSLRRGNLVHNAFEEIKSTQIRHFMLHKLLSGLNDILKRFENVFDHSANTSSRIVEFADVTSSFRLLQLIEYILVTTSKEPWIEPELWEKLCRAENRVLTKISLGHLLIFIARQTTLAKPLVKKRDNLEDESDSDDTSSIMSLG